MSTSARRPNLAIQKLLKTISDFPDSQIPEEEPPALLQSTTSEGPGDED